MGGCLIEPQLTSQYRCVPLPKTEVIKLESKDESVLEDRGGSDGEVIDEDEVMADGRGETEGKVATEMEEREVATDNETNHVA
ncbi:BQ5605_C004g03062 [Microbotryum silenes-dioicae]|uniref:BQ5605_C004g03062 protein n=1 Tax=Microbotryum silenes-dioicae TaxID=796604 RepID=A0A2X0MWR0_9BASI|nr:BQ5605_C004g03062 [Microbotryum silenes-dioicae]